jgi:hypothetical protein
MSTSSPLPPEVAGAAASRHDRAADAFISSYLRELMADDEQPATAPATTAAPADGAASDEPATLL